jgi:HD-GYP domain-containing protein (c-di-GMP phosphodiesterase class II)
VKRQVCLATNPKNDKSRKTHIRKLSASELAIGMYISELDRPWKTTPFPIRGFYIRDRDEIKRLTVHCNYVFIDTKKGIIPVEKDNQAARTEESLGDVFCGKLEPIVAKTNTYPVVETLKKEMPIAYKLHDNLLNELNIVMTQATNHCLKSVKNLVDVSHDVVDSLLRNPDALLWLVRARKVDNKSYYYMLRSALWAILFGRHLGLAKTDLRILALSLLLKDIGKLQLPKVLLLKQQPKDSAPSVDPEIGQIIIVNTVEMLQTLADLPPKVIKTIKMSREWLNGSGFPDKLRGDQILFLSKVASIASFYDDVSYFQSTKRVISVAQAISYFYKVRGIQFQNELVVEFVKAVGLYPTGSLVKLTTDEIGIVIEQNDQRRLKPKVMLVLNAQQQVLKKRQIIDLFEDDQRKQALLEAGKKAAKVGDRIDITQNVELDDYPIDLDEVRNIHIGNNTKKSFFSMFTSTNVRRDKEEVNG